MNPEDFHFVQNAHSRSHQSLNGEWHIIVDPYENGYYDYRYQPTDDHYGLCRQPKGPGDRVEYDFDASPTLRVPGDWNSQGAELQWYEGTVWYQRRFPVRLRSDRRYFLHFAGANYEAIVYLNGKRLGRHVGGFTAFEFEATADLVDGENFIVVKVDDQRRRDGVPTVNTDWYNFGGLTRDVLLLDVPQTFVRDYVLQLQKGSRHVLDGWVRLDGEQAAHQSVTVEIAELGVRWVVETNAQGRAALRCPVHAGDRALRLWSPEDPVLHRVTFSAGEDRVEERIGFRSVETQGPNLRLNGENLFLRGISLHEQAPERPGRATSEADARQLLGWAKELGCNFVRLAHYPHAEHVTRVADELGLLVWAEIPVYWTILWENEGTFESARQQLTEMIRRDHNRASVILWSVGNETPVSQARNDFLRRLIETARALDPTRLLTAALEHHYVDDDTVVLDDPLASDLDVLGCNQYVGWYDGPPEKPDALQWKIVCDKPLVFSELGAGAKAGHHGPAHQRWTEEFQARVYEHQIRMLQRIDQFRGMTPWILNDFQSPRRPLPGIQDGWNRKGLISDRGEKKQAFFVLRDFYRQAAAKPGATRR